jgi:hypothetical protein
LDGLAPDLAAPADVVRGVAAPDLAAAFFATGAAGGLLRVLVVGRLLAGLLVAGLFAVAVSFLPDVFRAFLVRSFLVRSLFDLAVRDFLVAVRAPRGFVLLVMS